MQIGNSVSLNTGDPIKTETKQSVSIVAKNTNFAHENHSETLGIKYEDKMEMTERKIGKLPIKTAIEMFNNAGVNVGLNNTVLFETSIFTGKAQYDFSDKANVYLKADVGTVNFGALDGKGTAGVGFRGAVGAQIGGFTAELFKEEYTNNYSLGATVGIKF